MDISQISIGPNKSTLYAMQTINNSNAQIALVVDEQQRLLGTITDGDIRRALLYGETLEVPVEKLMNRKFRSVRRSDDQDVVLEMMRQEMLKQIPVLDEQGRVVQLLLLQEILNPKQLSNAVVIMAGGKGTRLYPLTKDCPKPMLKIAGKPILQILIEQCIKAGFKEFYISVNYLKEQIVDYFGDGKEIGVSINYLEENEPMGTAGSLQLLPKTIADPFLVLNGDLLTTFDYSHVMRLHADRNPSATICVREHITQIPFGVVQTDGDRLISFEEKPTYRQLVNAGVYVIDPSILIHLEPNKPIDMPSLLAKSRASGSEILVCPIHEYWLDIGRPEALNTAQMDWKTHHG